MDGESPDKPITWLPQYHEGDKNVALQAWDVNYDDEGAGCWIRSVHHPDHWIGKDGEGIKLVPTKDRTDAECKFYLRTIEKTDAEKADMKHLMEELEAKRKAAEDDIED